MNSRKRLLRELGRSGAMVSFDSFIIDKVIFERIDSVNIGKDYIFFRLADRTSIYITPRMDIKYNSVNRTYEIKQDYKWSTRLRILRGDLNGNL